MRKTKIIATIGPSSSSEEIISSMIEAGVDVFRFNMKHNTPAWHSRHIQKVEMCAKRLEKRIGILIDLQGPEVRIDHFSQKSRVISSGEIISFSDSEKKGIPLDHHDIFSQIKKGQIVYADDGALSFRVVSVDKNSFSAKVIEGGILEQRKTLNFPGASFDFPVLVEKDMESISLAARHHVDFIALSYVRKADDIRILYKQMQKANVEADVIAKIEHPDAVKNFEDILEISNGVMVARGDLGIEYPLEEVPSLQKMIVRKARVIGRPVIIATQMLESMTKSLRPTRAEVSDVANAVYDSADAVMLSAESASGKYPVEAVRTMERIVTRVDETQTPSRVPVDWYKGGQTAAVVGAAYKLMKYKKEGDNDIDSFVIFTETGKTVQYLSRLRPDLPIIAFSENEKTLDKLKLSWGVLPYYYKYSKDKKLSISRIVDFLIQNGLVPKGKKVIMIYGEVLGKPGLTSIVRIQQIS